MSAAVASGPAVAVSGAPTKSDGAPCWKGAGPRCAGNASTLAVTSGRAESRDASRLTFSSEWATPLAWTREARKSAACAFVFATTSIRSLPGRRWPRRRWLLARCIDGCASRAERLTAAPAPCEDAFSLTGSNRADRPVDRRVLAAGSLDELVRPPCTPVARDFVRCVTKCAVV